MVQRGIRGLVIIIILSFTCFATRGFFEVCYCYEMI